MRRTGFKRKPISEQKPMKRGKLAKKSKSPQRKLEDEIWQHCRRIVFNRDSKDGKVDCYTCPATDLQGSNKQLGHVPWPKATLGAFLKYDLRLLKYQCFRCNINFSGMGGIAYPKMILENGAEFMNTLENERKITTKAIDHYKELLDKYSKLKESKD